MDWLRLEDANGGSPPSPLYEAGSSDSQVEPIDRPLPRRHRVIFDPRNAPTATVGLPSAAKRLDLLGQSGSSPFDSLRARQIEAFASFLGRSPDTATGDDIRRFQFAQVEQGAQPPKMNAQVSALRFFFTIAAPTSPISRPAHTIRGSCRRSLLQIRSPG